MMTFEVTDRGWIEEVIASGEGIACPRCREQASFLVDADVEVEMTGIHVRVKDARVECHCGWRTGLSKSYVYAGWTG